MGAYFEARVILRAVGSLTTVVVSRQSPFQLGETPKLAWFGYEPLFCAVIKVAEAARQAPAAIRPRRRGGADFDGRPEAPEGLEA
jgi:hypothetical protein